MIATMPMAMKIGRGVATTIRLATYSFASFLDFMKVVLPQSAR